MVTSIEHVCAQPGAEAFTLARDVVPGDIETVVALIAAGGVGGVGAAWDHAYGAHHPVGQHDGVERGIETIYLLFHGHEQAARGERRLAGGAEDAADEYVAGAVHRLRMQD